MFWDNWLSTLLYICAPQNGTYNIIFEYIAIYSITNSISTNQLHLEKHKLFLPSTEYWGS